MNPVLMSSHVLPSLRFILIFVVIYQISGIRQITTMTDKNFN